MDDESYTLVADNEKGMEQEHDSVQSFQDEKGRATGKIEDDETSLGKDFSSFKEDFDQFKEDQDLLSEKVNGKLQTLNDDAQEIHEDNEKIKEQIKQLEGVSNDNAEVINKFTIAHITFEDKFEKLEKEADDMLEQMDKMQEKVKVIVYLPTFFINYSTWYLILLQTV